MHYMNESETEKYSLIIAYLQGHLESKEELKLIAWLRESDINKAFFNKVELVWLASSQLKKESNAVKSEPVLKRIHAIINKNSNSRLDKSTTDHTRFRIIRKAIKIAAFWTLLVFAGGVLSFLIFDKEGFNANNIQTFEAPMGSNAFVTLPDGSKIWLNAGSKISYLTSYNKKHREVTLIGEAFFNVVKNPAKPFIVSAENLKIKAYGTTFNVKAYPEESEVITTLVEGQTTIEGNDLFNKHFALKMKPSQTVKYLKTKNTITSKSKRIILEHSNSTDEQKLSGNIPVLTYDKVNTILFTSWKDERWVVENEELQDLVVKLERRYNVTIRFDSEEVKRYHFSGTIQNEMLEQVLKILSLTVPIEYTIEKDQVVLTTNTQLRRHFQNTTQ